MYKFMLFMIIMYGNVMIIMCLYDSWISGVMVEVSRNRNVVWLLGVVILGRLVLVLIVIVRVWKCL